MKFDIKKYIPTILTVASCVGVVGTAIVASKDGSKASKIISANTDIKCTSEDGELTIDGIQIEEIKPDWKEQIKLTWKCYIPTIIISTATIGSIIFNHKLTTKQMAAIVACSGASGRLLMEYKEKIKEVYGEEGLAEIKRKVAEKRAESKGEEIQIASIPVMIQEGLIDTEYDFSSPDNHNELFYDEWTDTWFYSNLVAVKTAIFQLNRNFQMRACASLGEFYEMLGINIDPEEIPWRIDSYAWGWGEGYLNDSGYSWIDIETTSAVDDEGTQYYIIDYPYPPEGISNDERDFIGTTDWKYLQRNAQGTI